MSPHRDGVSRHGQSVSVLHTFALVPFNMTDYVTVDTTSSIKSALIHSNNHSWITQVDNAQFNFGGKIYNASFQVAKNLSINGVVIEKNIMNPFSEPGNVVFVIHLKGDQMKLKFTTQLDGNGIFSAKIQNSTRLVLLKKISEYELHKKSAVDNVITTKQFYMEMEKILERQRAHIANLTQKIELVTKDIAMATKEFERIENSMNRSTHLHQCGTQFCGISNMTSIKITSSNTTEWLYGVTCNIVKDTIDQVMVKESTKAISEIVTDKKRICRTRFLRLNETPGTLKSLKNKFEKLAIKIPYVKWCPYEDVQVIREQTLKVKKRWIVKADKDMVRCSHEKAGSMTNHKELISWNELQIGNCHSDLCKFLPTNSSTVNTSTLRRVGFTLKLHNAKKQALLVQLENSSNRLAVLNSFGVMAEESVGDALARYKEIKNNNIVQNIQKLITKSLLINSISLESENITGHIQPSIYIFRMNIQNAVSGSHHVKTVFYLNELDESIHNVARLISNKILDNSTAQEKYVTTGKEESIENLKLSQVNLKCTVFESAVDYIGLYLQSLHKTIEEFKATENIANRSNSNIEEYFQALQKNYKNLVNTNHSSNILDDVNTAINKQYVSLTWNEVLLKFHIFQD